MHEVEACYLLRFVALQMSDEMPADLRANRVHLLDRLLDAVLTHVAEPCSERRFDGLGAMRLGHSDHRDPLRVASALPCGVDTIPDLPQAIRQVRKSHNAPSYRRLQSEASESPWAAVGVGASDKRGHCRRPSA